MTPARAYPPEDDPPARQSPASVARARRAGTHLAHHDEEHAVEDDPRRKAQRVKGGSHFGPAHGAQMEEAPLNYFKSKTING